MALNGDIGSWVHNSRYNGYGIFITWSATQNDAGNYSDVTVSVSMRSSRGDTWFSGYDTDIWIEINGNSDHKVLGGFSLGANVTKPNIYSRTVRVPHGSDGNKSFTYSATITNGVIGKLSASSTGALTKIPRAYDFNYNTSTVAMESPLTVNIGYNGSGYTAKVYMYFGNKNLLLYDNAPIGSNFTITPKASDYADQVPNNTIGDGSVRVETWDGGTKIGEVKKPIRLTLPASYTPSIASATYKDQNNAIKAITGSDQLLVNGYSIPRMSVDAHGIYGSTIVEYKFEIKGTTITNNGYLTDISLQTYDFGAGSIPVTVTVKDSRDRTATTTINLNILAYSAPSLLNFSALRIAAEDGTMTTIQVKKTVSVSSIKNGTTEKNTYTVKTEIKKTSDTAWQTVKTETNTSSNFNLIGYSILDSYDIRITVADTISASTPAVIRDIITTDSVLMDKYRNEALGIGKYAEPGKGMLQVGGMIWMNNQSLLDTFYPIGSIYQSTNSANPSTFMGGTWIRMAQGQTLVGVDESDADFNAPGNSGGEKSHKLTANEMAHNHVQTERFSSSYSAGNGHQYTNGGSTATDTIKTSGVADVTNQAHNNMQPYTTVYMWRRTA